MDKVKDYLKESIKLMVKHLGMTDAEAREYLRQELEKERSKVKPRKISEIVKGAGMRQQPAQLLAKSYDIMPGYQTAEQDQKNKYHL
jgi:hypothetical protein